MSETPTPPAGPATSGPATTGPATTGPATSGRVVAELGRPETPQETADRKSAASVARRRNQTSRNLVLALLASLAIVAFLVLVVVRPDQTGPNPVDYRAAAAAAGDDAGAPLVVPDLPKTWTANRAEYSGDPSDGVPSWDIGFLTPKDQYIGFSQGVDANTAWVDGRLDGARSTGERQLAGVTWTEYDRRDSSDPGNVAYALSAEFGQSTIVLAGTAVDSEFETLAEAVVADAATTGTDGGDE